MSPVQSVMVLLGLSDDPMRLSADERVYQAFRASGLSVYSVPQSRVIVVNYESKDPELSALIANTIAETYLSFQRAAQATNTRSATSFLETEIAELRQQVSEAEAAVARFRSGSNLFVGVNDTTLSAQQLSELSTELSRARAAESEARSRAQEIRTLIAQQGTQVALPESFSTPLTQRLQEEQATLRARIAELSATLLPAHPRLRELNAQLGDLAGQLRSEAGRIAARFDNEARVAAARAQALQDSLARLSAEASRIADAEVELRALEREAAAQRDLLASYLVRYREAATRDDSANLPTNARIIQTAQVEREPVFPQTLPMIILAMVGSIAIAVLVVTSAAILAGSVPVEEADPSDPPGEPVSRRREPMPVTVQQAAPEVVPDEKPFAVAATASARPADQHDEPVHQAVTRLRAMAPRSTLPSYALDGGDGEQAVMARLRALAASTPGARLIVGAADDSAVAGEVALHLARALADQSPSVVMMDCAGDLRGKAMAPDGPGFYELITGSVGFDAALHRDRQSPLHLVPAGFSQADRSMIADDAADLVISALAETYDIVMVNVGHDQDLLRDCAGFSDGMILCGEPGHISALASRLSGLVPPDRLVSVRTTGHVAVAG
jgi:succinoglycan biosynthesis transport protein ExoP